MANEAKKAMNAANISAVVNAVNEGRADEVIRAGLMADIRKIHYDASILKGFTPEQAIILCTDQNLK
jgi:hypothetical protein